MISFLSRLADVFSFVHDTAPDRGGSLAARTGCQVYFWDQRQFEELAKAIGRHLNSIVMPQTERYLRGIAWLFPPDELLQDDELTLANPLTFMKVVVQRDLRLPVAHCLTLFNVAESYPDLISDEESFLLQLQRTNVAISRARAKCVLIMSEDLAFHLPSDRETIITSKAVKTYISDFCRELMAFNVPAGATERQLTLRWHQS